MEKRKKFPMEKGNVNEMTMSTQTKTSFAYVTVCSHNP
jgi:hypothetical protein